MFQARLFQANSGATIDLAFLPWRRLWQATDCGLKALPRFVAFEKLKSLVRAANRVRAELPARKKAAA